MTGRARLLPHRRRPCQEGPWSKDTPPGQFPASRYEQLRTTSQQEDGQQPGPSAPLFACHKTPEGREAACAGWLAAVGHQHVGVRVAIAERRLSWQALSRRADWPELFDSFPEMAARQGRTEEHR